MRVGVAAWLLWASVASGAELYSYWIQPCPAEIAEQSGCESTDPELARWALDAWERKAGPGLHFVPAPGEYTARIRIYWLGKRPQLYGDTRMMLFEGRPAASIQVHPDLTQFGPEIATAGKNDRLFRDTVVYLTCLHETGHAIGLPHTAEFDDIMYSFQFGGDVLEYFTRYRRKLKERADIRTQSGISAGDRKQAVALYAEK